MLHVGNWVVPFTWSSQTSSSLGKCKRQRYGWQDSSAISVLHAACVPGAEFGDWRLGPSLSFRIICIHLIIRGHWAMRYTHERQALNCLWDQCSSKEYSRSVASRIHASRDLRVVHWALDFKHIMRSQSYNGCVQLCYSCYILFYN